jgi:hypothetical protein
VELRLPDLGTWDSRLTGVRVRRPPNTIANRSGRRLTYFDQFCTVAVTISRLTISASRIERHGGASARSKRSSNMSHSVDIAAMRSQ